MILPSDLAWLIKELPSGPPAQVRDALVEILEAFHAEIGALQKQVERLKLRDAPFKNTFKSSNGSMPSTDKKQGTKLMSTKIRGEGVSGSAVGPATSAEKVA